MRTIQFLAGVSHIDILRIHGVSKAALFKHVKKVTGLIADNEDMGAVEWPESLKACDKFALQWAGSICFAMGREQKVAQAPSAGFTACAQSRWTEFQLRPSCQKKKSSVSMILVLATKNRWD
jgi:hypothetical protein